MFLRYKPKWLIVKKKINVYCKSCIFCYCMGTFNVSEKYNSVSGSNKTQLIKTP